MDVAGAMLPIENGETWGKKSGLNHQTSGTAAEMLEP
jgi:hypothetical protein